MKKIFFLVLISFVVMFFFSGCASVSCPNKPDWYLKGSGAFPGDRGIRIYGVGYGESPMMQARKNAADNRARQELADTLQINVKKLVTDFIEQHKDYFNPDTAGADEFTQTISKSVTDQQLMGAQIIDRWECEEKNMMASLAVVDLNSPFWDMYKNKMKQMIRDKHRAIVKEKADEAAKELDKEIKEQRARENEILGIPQQ